MSDYWDEVVETTAEPLLAILEDWVGSGVALSRGELCSRLECTDSVLRSAIAHLRRQGHLIVAINDGGYRLAQSVEEAREYLERLAMQVSALQETIEAMEMELRRRRSSQQLRMEL
jgi:biotin operon repressor